MIGIYKGPAMTVRCPVSSSPVRQLLSITRMCSPETACVPYPANGPQSNPATLDGPDQPSNDCDLFRCSRFSLIRRRLRDIGSLAATATRICRNARHVQVGRWFCANALRRPHLFRSVRRVAASRKTHRPPDLQRQRYERHDGGHEGAEGIYGTIVLADGRTGVVSFALPAGQRGRPARRKTIPPN